MIVQETIRIARQICAGHDPNKAYQYLEGQRDDYMPMTAVIAALQFGASAAGAGTAETRNVAQGEARQSGAQSADAQSPSPITPNGA